MGTEIERREPAALAAPMTHEGEIGHMIRLAETLATARGIVPDYLQGNPGNIVAVLLTGRELGLSPMASLRGLHLVKGKVGLDYSTMVALLRRHGYGVAWPETGPERCTLRLTHPDGSEHVETWDKARAKLAGLWGQRGPWSNYPESMLRARCVSSAGRAFAGDVLAGVYSTEEAREIAKAKGAPVPDLEAELAEESTPPMAAVRVAELVPQVTAGDLSADDARGRIWAAVDGAEDVEEKRAIASAAAQVVAAAYPERGKEWVIAERNRWVTEPPPDDVEDAEIVEDDPVEEAAAAMRSL